MLEEAFSAVTDEPQKAPRRNFLETVALGLFAAFAGGLWLLRQWYRSRPLPARVVAQAGEIPVGGFLIFQYPGNENPCILIRPAEETYLAFSHLCTHNSCPVFYTPDENAFLCRCHGGALSVTDGSVLQGPPPRPLPRILLERNGSEIVANGIAKG